MILLQLAERIRVARLSALLALAALAAPLVLPLLEGPVAQLLLAADHVAEFIERRHHVVVAVVAGHPGRAICRFSSIDCSCSSSARAASFAPERASCSSRSSMLRRSCDRNWRALGSSGRASCGFLRISSASACRNLSSAARNSSINRLISSSLAPRSSAWRSRSWAARNCASASATSPSSSWVAIAHSSLTTSRKSLSVLARASCQ